MPLRLMALPTLLHIWVCFTSVDSLVTKTTEEKIVSVWKVSFLGRKLGNDWLCWSCLHKVMPECTPHTWCVCVKGGGVGKKTKKNRRGWEGVAPESWLCIREEIKEKKTHGRCGGDERLCGRVGLFLSYGWFLFFSVVLSLPGFTCFPGVNGKKKKKKKKRTFKCGNKSKNLLSILFISIPVRRSVAPLERNKN